MNSCEHYEADLSAILDGEVEMVDLKRTLDHLVACPRCAEFYRRSRDLGQAVASSRETSKYPEESDASELMIDPPPELWQRIAERAPWNETESHPRSAITPASRSRRRALMEWAPRLAAAFVLVLGLWMMQLVVRESGSAGFFRETSEASTDHLAKDELTESRIGESLPEMSDERFVELATEVLEADPRYHYEMLAVMKTATRGIDREGTVDHRKEDEGFGLFGSRSEMGGTSDARIWR
ncbi:MAG: anti-sigma factor [Thermoanaerobaculia bacterium]|nr:anti-sigma factor [Thermoanaerobaculia bacterium]